MKILLSALLALTVMGTVPAQQVDYRFDEVRRNVVCTSAQQELHVRPGDRAKSGDFVQTGWFSYALIASDHYRAKFEIFSSTQVQLTGGTPGVILSLERGRLHAMFDKITGEEPRVVQTPGALLAVRGTEYTVNVDSTGQTTLDVYQGTVEVRSKLRPEPYLVHAGEESTFSQHEPPVMQPMPPERRGMSGERIGEQEHGEQEHGEPHDVGPEEHGEQPHTPQGTQRPPPTTTKSGGHH